MSTGICVTGVAVITAAGQGDTALRSGRLSVAGAPHLIDAARECAIPSHIDTGPYELHRAQKIAVAAFLAALQDAGLDPKSAEIRDMGLFMGNAYGIEEFRTGFFRQIRTSGPGLTAPGLFPFTAANSIAASLSALFNVTGPNLTFACGGTSSMEAIIAACDAIGAGNIDLAVVGGLSLFCADLADTLLECGFLTECCAMLVLENVRAVSAVRRCYALVEDTGHEFGVEPADPAQDRAAGIPADSGVLTIVHRGDSFSEKAFACGPESDYYPHLPTLRLDNLFGNLFSAAGCLGTALGSLSVAGHAGKILPEGMNAPGRADVVAIDSYGNSAHVKIGSIRNAGADKQ